MNNLAFRPNVCLIITNTAGEILLGKRYKTKDEWQLPQGGYDSSESIAESALREAHEELGVSQNTLEVDRILDCVHEYDWIEPRKYKEGIFRGQRQQFVCLSFFGSDDLIKLDRFEQELEEFCWCTVSQILEKSDLRRVEGYKKAFAELQRDGCIKDDVLVARKLRMTKS